MKKLLLSGVAIVAITVVGGEPAKAAPPVYNWTGCYVGGNIGGGWTRKEFTPGTFGAGGEGSINPSSIIGGAQFGCDVQNGMWVFGAQGMFDWTNLHGQDPFFLGKAFSNRIPWFATATGRIGYTVQPTTLVFVRGGAAFVRDKYQFIESPSFIDATASETRRGWTFGGGFDWMFAPNWSFSVEYGYMGFGTRAVPFHGLINFSENIDQRAHFVLVSMNYRFGSWGGR